MVDTPLSLANNPSRPLKSSLPSPLNSKIALALQMEGGIVIEMVLMGDSIRLGFVNEKREVEVLSLLYLSLV